LLIKYYIPGFPEGVLLDGRRDPGREMAVASGRGTARGLRRALQLPLFLPPGQDVGVCLRVGTMDDAIEQVPVETEEEPAEEGAGRHRR
jgi:hypothetical protein